MKLPGSSEEIVFVEKIQFVRKTPQPGLQESVVLFILPDRGGSLGQATGVLRESPLATRATAVKREFQPRP